MLFVLRPGLGATPPESTTLPAYKDHNTPREFPTITTRTAWQQRARAIREQILVSAGLWPLPEKTPLNAHVFGRLEREGYSIEKVYFETSPGIYLAGNLYRPLGRGPGPFPGVLNPHGHWKEGRLVDNNDASVPARCINFALQGMVAFAYDLVGFNDTHFLNAPTNRPFYDIHRQFGTNRTDQLWSISLMGLQTWNSIRALDFLASLPDVDPHRLACTGASGGGTQTFILGAIDDRLAAQAPVVMVSHTMQGGCSCENMPGLRVEFSNMEIAAAAAPRPQLLVASSRDWTKDTLTVEGPALAHIYELFDSPDRLGYVRFDFGHNYNQTSREAVYQWFGQWLLNQRDTNALKEVTCHKEADADLRVFPDGKLPAGALTQEEFIASLKQRHQSQWRSLLPHDAASLEHFKQWALPAWRHTLQVNGAISATVSGAQGVQTTPQFKTATLRFNRTGESNTVQAIYWAPANLSPHRPPTLVILCSAAPSPNQPVAPATSETVAPASLAASLLQRGFAVLALNRFSTETRPNPFTNFFTTYNRTLLQERVRDLLTVCAAADQLPGGKPRPFRKVLVGTGRAGLWALLAAPGADAVIADCDQLDVTQDESLLASDLFCPGLRNLGTFEGAPLLAAPHPLLLHNTGAHFPTAGLRLAYQGLRAQKNLRLESGPLSDAELAQWLAQAL